MIAFSILIEMMRELEYWGATQLKGFQRRNTTAAETKRAGPGTSIFSSLKCATNLGPHSELFSARVQRSTLTPALPPALSASLPLKWRLSLTRSQERGSREHQPPLSCEMPSQPWLVDLRRCRAKFQGGESAERSRSAVPNPAINSLLVNFVDLYELIVF